MTGIEEYGIKADERLQLAAYRAGFKAFRLMGVLSFVAFVTLLAFGNEVGAMTVAGISIVGMAVFEHLVEKEGWEQFLQEEIQSHPEVRKRAIRREIRFGVIGAVYIGCMAYFFHSPGDLMSAVFSGLAFGVITFFLAWRQRLRKQRSRSSVSS